MRARSGQSVVVDGEEVKAVLMSLVSMKMWWTPKKLEQNIDMSVLLVSQIQESLLHDGV